MPLRARRAAALLLVLAAGAIAYAWASGALTPAPHETSVDANAPRVLIHRAARTDPRPDILLFTIDTLRADHASTNGYERATTPTLTTLAARGTRFERAYSSSSWTAPSVASLMTGMLPSQHGVRHGFWLDSDTVAGQEVLSSEIPTLATTLHDAGYRTVGITANVHLDPLLGFARGFDTYDSLDFTASATEVSAALARHEGALRDGDTPYFLWIHLIEPHAPYRPRRPIFDTWWPPSSPQYTQIDSFMLEEFMDAMFRRENIPPEEGLAYAVAAYDSEIRTADDFLGDVLRRLDDGHLAVVVAADHGEEFHDHLRMGHGHSAFEEVVRVPLVMALPDGAAHVVSTAVSIVDVMPTLLELAHVDPRTNIAGRSLTAALDGHTLEARDLFIETGRGHEIVRAIVRDGIKYGERIQPAPVRGLFDLAVDPHEQHNLVEEDPARADALRDELHRVLDAASALRPTTTTAPIDLTDVQRAQLRALGYGN